MLARFSGHQTWQMINADYCQFWAVTTQVEGNRGLDEGTVLLIEWDRVVGVAGVTANIANNAKFAAGFRQLLLCEEWRDRLAK